MREGYGKFISPVKVIQQNTQVKCMIYGNLHNVDLEKIVNVEYAKEIWDKL